VLGGESVHLAQMTDETSTSPPSIAIRGSQGVVLVRVGLIFTVYFANGSGRASAGAGDRCRGDGALHALFITLGEPNDA
jgi:hypothetical protein